MFLKSVFSKDPYARCLDGEWRKFDDRAYRAPEVVTWDDVETRSVTRHITMCTWILCNYNPSMSCIHSYQYCVALQCKRLLRCNVKGYFLIGFLARSSKQSEAYGRVPHLMFYEIMWSDAAMITRYRRAMSWVIGAMFFCHVHDGIQWWTT